MKHRSKKTKHQHTMIQGLRKTLESIAVWPEIKTMIPGAIRPVKKAASQLKIYIQYETTTGLKCLVKSGTAVQELFIVTPHKQRVRKRLEGITVT